MKSHIIEHLGQTDLLLPALIAEGLAANDRVKVRLSVLQAAGRRAQDPEGAPFDLGDECRGAGIDATAMKALVNSAGKIAGGQVAATGLDDLKASVRDDVATMIRAVSAADTAEGDTATARLDTFATELASDPPDHIAATRIARLTGIADGGSDSLHRLVMDLHKALNRQATAHAEEVLAGAHVSGLRDADRPAVEAFMRGVEATRGLKFGHPGLSTTAVQAGGRLTIQNDIGETDAHVVVIAVDGTEVTVTYTDVHRARAKFFARLSRDFPVDWSGLDRKNAEGLGDDGTFYLVTGRYAAPDAAARDAFLELLGASLVFLIDWNKARKLLRTWVSKGDAIDILDWGARNRVGHRGFLALGGGDLVASAVHHATPTRIGFGERLDRVLGREAANDFLKTVLRVSAEALLEGGSVRLARDRIETDLVRHLQRIDATLLAIVIRQSGLAREIAAGIARFVAEQQAQRPGDGAGLARWARRIEEKADKIAVEARREVVRFEADRTITSLVDRIEDVIDDLEQAAFVASLLPDGVGPGLLRPLALLCASTITGTEAAATGIAAASDIPDGQRVDSEDALAAVGRLLQAEHEADAAEREVTALVLRGEHDLKTSLSVLELARALERATDRLAGFGHLLRERVLTELST